MRNIVVNKLKRYPDRCSLLALLWPHRQSFTEHNNFGSHALWIGSPKGQFRGGDGKRGGSRGRLQAIAHQTGSLERRSAVQQRQTWQALALGP